MIGLLFALQCLSQTFTDPAQLCRYTTRIARLEGRYYADSLVCKGQKHPVKHHDLNLLMGRIYELEEANRKLRAKAK
jgi:hypothetical protein